MKQMVEKSEGRGQLKKLIYRKTFSDAEGVKWKLSTWKVMLWMIAITTLLVILYSFLTEDQGDFLQNVLFYAIITMIVVMIVWIMTHIIWKARKLFIGFVLAWILILGLYILLGASFSYVGFMDFHFGFTTWMVITCLAGLGAKRIDGSLDKNDVGYGMLVLLILIIGNYPIFESGGFFAQVDNFLGFIASKLSLFININDLLAS